MRPLNIEILMDHKTGVSDSYYKPTEHELREDYLKAVDYLTINKDQKIATQLQKQVADLTEKNEQENEHFKKELEDTKARMTILQANTENLYNVLIGKTDTLVLNSWRVEEGPLGTAKLIEEKKGKGKEMI